MDYRSESISQCQPMMEQTCPLCNGTYTLWSCVKGNWCSCCKKWSWQDSADIGMMPTLHGTSVHDMAHSSGTFPDTLLMLPDECCTSKPKAFRCTLVASCDHVIDLTKDDDDDLERTRALRTSLHTITGTPPLRRTRHTGNVGVFDEQDKAELSCLAPVKRKRARTS